VQGLGHGGNILWRAKCQPYSIVVCIKKTYSGVQGQSSLKLNFFSFWTFSGSRKFACFLFFIEATKSHIYVLPCVCSMCMVTRGHFITIIISSGGAAWGKAKGMVAPAPLPTPLAPPMLCKM